MRLIRGFTLIELMIVIMILGLLAEVAAPKFATTKEKKKLVEQKIAKLQAQAINVQALTTAQTHTFVATTGEAGTAPTPPSPP